MQTWARRGLQTALVTGGLLMLGTGIASANEDVSPDRPASGLDVGIDIPVHMHNNVLATPLGTKQAPDMDRTISTPHLSNIPMLSNHTGILSQILRDNQLRVRLGVPVQIANNALALGRDAAVSGTDQQYYGHPEPLAADGTGDTLNGNALDVQDLLPVQLTGNAVGALGGHATAESVADQNAITGGNIDTCGLGGTLAGNVLAGFLDTPLQVTGNGVAALSGTAHTDSQAASTTKTGGAITGNGSKGSLDGNVGAVPVALPTELNGNGLSALGGKAHANSQNSADAQAGDRNPDSLGNPFQTLTHGSNGLLGGNVLQPEVAGPALVNHNALVALADGGTADGTTDNRAQAGGGIGSDAIGSALSGNAADAPIANPVEVMGNGAGFGGPAKANETNTVKSIAGGSVISYGSTAAGVTPVVGGAFASANEAVTPIAGETALCGIGAGGLGPKTSSGTCNNNADVTSGGYNGATGSDSPISGNILNTPLTPGLEAGGLGAAAAGNGTGSIDEIKNLTAGGTTNTNDDNGLISSNLATLPEAPLFQAFGNAVGAFGKASSHTTNTTTTTAGGDAMATGKSGAISGNILRQGTSLPAELTGIAAMAGRGTASADATNNVTSAVGGKATSTGERGTISGNIADVPAASAVQLAALGASALNGTAAGTANNMIASSASGSDLTNGDNGSLSGNVLSGQLLPITQAVGIGAAAIGGTGAGSGVSNTTASSGGDVTTSAQDASLSGNALTVPAAVVAQALGDAAGVAGGKGIGIADNTLTGTAGGVNSTTGDHSKLSGLDGQLPLGVDASIIKTPIELLGGHAIAEATNDTLITDGGQVPQINLPIGGGADSAAMPATALPTLPNLSTLPAVTPVSPVQPVSSVAPIAPAVPVSAAQPTVQTQSAPADVVPGLGGSGLNVLPVGEIAGVLPAFSTLPAVVPAIPVVPALPLSAAQSKLQTQSAPADVVPGLGGSGLNVLPVGEIAGVLPAFSTLPAVVPAIPVVPALPLSAAHPTAQTQSAPADVVPPLTGIPGLGDGLDLLPVGALTGHLPSVPAVSALPVAPLSAAHPTVQTQSAPADVVPPVPGLNGIGGKGLGLLPLGGVMPGQFGQLPTVGGVPGSAGASQLPGMSDLPGIPALPMMDTGSAPGMVGGMFPTPTLDMPDF